MTLRRQVTVVMPRYNPVASFVLYRHILLILYLHWHVHETYSILTHIQHNYRPNIAGINRLFCPGQTWRDNCSFSRSLFCIMFVLTTLFWLAILLLNSGDIHPNPGPMSSTSSPVANADSTANTERSEHSSSSDSVAFALDLAHNISLIHYNVQSILPKLDIITSELHEFDILAFTETWLNGRVTTSELAIPSFSEPERKDRADSHGGVILYVKDNIHFIRRHDLEIIAIENIWIELLLNKKKVLLGVFYRAPNSDATYNNLIEDSIHLAVDTGIKDIIITGDFNYNILLPPTSQKVDNISLQYNLHQIINDYTHFTETSSSIIDLMFVSDKNTIVASGVADPFLNQEQRYHCPIFALFKFKKPKIKHLLGRSGYTSKEIMMS